MKQWKQAIEQWIDRKEEQLIRQIGQLVAVPSVGGPDAGPGKPFGEDAARVLEVAAALAEQAGLRTENVEGYVVTADLNDRPDGLHILAHLDVVDPGDGWDSDPYTLRREGDLIYGRGVDDDKGPAVAVLLAMECVRDLGIPLERNVKLILGGDEESGSRDVAYYYEHHPYAPCAVTPDAEFPVINIEKGRYAPTFRQSWPEESALPRVASLTGGIRVNVAPRNAQAVVLGLSRADVEELAAQVAQSTGTELAVTDAQGGVTLICTGREAHASTPDEGVNGITALLDLLARLPLADLPSTRALQGLAKQFPHGDNHGTALGIDQSDGKSGRITVALSLLELDGTGLRGQFDARVPLCATEENCAGRVETQLQSLGFAVEGTMSPAHEVEEESPFVQTLLRCYEDCTGRPGRCVAIGGGTYVHDIPGGVAFGMGDFDFDSRLHSANERARVSALLTAAKIYANVIAAVCRRTEEEEG